MRIFLHIFLHSKNIYSLCSLSPTLLDWFIPHYFACTVVFLQILDVDAKTGLVTVQAGARVQVKILFIDVGSAACNCNLFGNHALIFCVCRMSWKLYALLIWHCRTTLLFESSRLEGSPRYAWVLFPWSGDCSGLLAESYDGKTSQPYLFFGFFAILSGRGSWHRSCSPTCWWAGRFHEGDSIQLNEAIGFNSCSVHATCDLYCAFIRQTQNCHLVAGGCKQSLPCDEPQRHFSLAKNNSFFY